MQAHVEPQARCYTLTAASRMLTGSDKAGSWDLEFGEGGVMSTAQCIVEADRLSADEPRSLKSQKGMHEERPYLGLNDKDPAAAQLELRAVPSGS